MVVSRNITSPYPPSAEKRPNNFSMSPLILAFAFAFSIIMSFSVDKLLLSMSIAILLLSKSGDFLSPERDQPIYLFRFTSNISPQNHMGHFQYDGNSETHIQKSKSLVKIE